MPCRSELPATQLDQPFVLVTPGGGGDGEALVDWTLRAYENDPTLEPAALIVYGPFLNGERRLGFDQRVEALGPRVTAVGFESRIEGLMQRRAGRRRDGRLQHVLRNPVVRLPRRHRAAHRAAHGTAYPRFRGRERLGLIRMLDRDRDGCGPEVMASAIRGLASQSPPSGHAPPGFMDGLERIIALAKSLISVPVAYGRRLPGPPGRLAIVLKGWPRLSETFIAQELVALESGA